MQRNTVSAAISFKPTTDQQVALNKTSALTMRLGPRLAPEAPLVRLTRQRKVSHARGLRSISSGHQYRQELAREFVNTGKPAVPSPALA